MWFLSPGTAPCREMRLILSGELKLRSSILLKRGVHGKLWRYFVTLIQGTGFAPWSLGDGSLFDLVFYE
jgi:hypothetical protein